MTAGSKNLGDNFLLKQYISGQIFPSKSHRTIKKNSIYLWFIRIKIIPTLWYRFVNFVCIYYEKLWNKNYKRYEKHLIAKQKKLIIIFKTMICRIYFKSFNIFHKIKHTELMIEFFLQCRLQTIGVIYNTSWIWWDRQ